jgi:hypothetical protein
MAMPFPGMDPYLEHPVLWPSVHTRLMVWIAHQLGPRLRPRYIATVEERVYLEGPNQERVPDVHVQRVRGNGGSTAVAEPASHAPLILEVEELEIREHYVQILDRLRDMRVVAVIEVLSPSNKTPGPGRDAYLEKRREALASECHLIEIDLLRRGHHVLSVPEASVRAEASYDYLACVNRWPRRKRFELYPWRLRDPLPQLWLPLTAPDPDMPLDLQPALEQVYADGSYDLRVLYDQPCEPALGPDDQQWANECWATYRAAHPDLFPPAEPERPREGNESQPGTS